MTDEPPLTEEEMDAIAKRMAEHIDHWARDEDHPLKHLKRKEAMKEP